MKQFVKKIIFFFFSVIPKNPKKIIFESHSDLTDSSKAFYDYLKKNRPGKYRYIWMVDNGQDFLKEKDTVFININKPFSFAYIYHAITSKYVFFTHRAIRWINLKKQVSVNLTHGLPFKNSKGKLPEDKDFNHLLSTSENISQIVAEQHNSDISKIFLNELPRNDLLQEEKENVLKIKKNYSKMIVWLPTFRKHYKITANNQNDNPIPFFKDSDFNKLNNYLMDKNILLILKFHPAQDLTKLKQKDYSNLLFWTNQDLKKRNIELYSLLASADVLLTDYSSVSFDFVLLDRPIGYIHDDIITYQKERDFIFENYEEYLAGEIIKTKQQFYSFIENTYENKDDKKGERKKIKDFYHQKTTNDACASLANHFHL